MATGATLSVTATDGDPGSDPAGAARRRDRGRGRDLDIAFGPQRQRPAAAAAERVRGIAVEAVATRLAAIAGVAERDLDLSLIHI